MATTVHIPAALLHAVDRRAKVLRLSRNRLIVQTLQQAINERQGWPPEFLDRLRDVDAETVAAVDDLVAHVKHARGSKQPRDL